MRLSAVQSFVTRTPLAISYPFGSGRNARNSHPELALRNVPSFGRLHMAESVVAAESNATSADLPTSALKGATETITKFQQPRNERGTVILADADEFIKPDRDMRDYRVIKLQNNLQALLVSTSNTNGEDDDSARVEAASMHIQAGHFDDTIPGLAHFYEHMLVCMDYWKTVRVCCETNAQLTSLPLYFLGMSFSSFWERKSTPMRMNTKGIFLETEGLPMPTREWNFDC